MPVATTDITVYDANDWELQVDGVPVKHPSKFTVTPEFAADMSLIETLEGEAGFSIASASTKGTCKISVKRTSPSVAVLDGLAEQRKVVNVFLVCRQNQGRYPIKQRGFAFAILKPAEDSVEKSVTDMEYEAVGFGYKRA